MNPENPNMYSLTFADNPHGKWSKYPAVPEEISENVERRRQHTSAEWSDLADSEGNIYADVEVTPLLYSDEGSAGTVSEPMGIEESDKYRANSSASSSEEQFLHSDQRYWEA